MLRRNGRETLKHAIVAVMCFLFLLMAFSPIQERALSGKNDFVQLYAGATYVQTPNLYNIEAHKKLQIGLFGDYYPSVYYTRLPFYALLLSPLSRLPYLTAYAIYQSFSMAIVFSFLYLYLKRAPDLILVVATSLPLLINFGNGQDAGVVAAIAGFAILLRRQDKEFLAGMLLSLASIKIHLLILVPIVLLIHRRWRMLAGGITGGIILLLLSFVGGGWNWLDGFLAMISNPELHPGAEHMTTYRNLVSLAMGGEQRIPELALSGLTAALVGYLAWKIQDFEIAFAISLVAGLLVCFHAYSQDLVMLLAALLIVATGTGTSKALRFSLTWASTPPLAFLLLAGAPFSGAVPLVILAVVVSGFSAAETSP